MKKILLIVFLVPLLAIKGYTQISVLKMLGKHSEYYKMGFGAFYTIEIPVDEYGTSSVVLELIDFGYFPSNYTSDYYDEDGGVASIKLGYRYIFSDEGKTGFYIEPQAGFGWTGVGETGSDVGKGPSLGIIGGYSLEVGQGGNNFLFGLKFESYLTGKDKTVSTIGFRVAFNYRLFRGRNFY